MSTRFEIKPNMNKPNELKSRYTDVREEVMAMLYVLSEKITEREDGGVTWGHLAVLASHHQALDELLLPYFTASTDEDDGRQDMEQAISDAADLIAAESPCP